MLHALVMAGGSGTRFWPESRADRPKQLLPLGGPHTLLQETLSRLEGLVPPERIVVATSARLVEAVAAQIPQVPREAILGEPCKRDTAPCIGLAAMLIARLDPAAVLVVLPSDHVISPESAFRDAVAEAVRLVEAQPSRIVTFGVRPTYPAETFGYIERGAVLPTAERCAAFEVRNFKEKPPLEVARRYVAAGSYYWNAGIFVWKAATILDALLEHQHEMHDHLARIAAARGGDFDRAFAEEYAAIRGVSIDYAVMEHARDVAVIEAPFAWDDVGSWQALARLRGRDSSGNTVLARHLGINTTGTIVRSGDDHLIVTLGVKDCVIVHTPDATLVADKHQEEAIRDVVKRLQANGWTEFL
jgi:mannose-1-phosphate guanylyltransferase